MNPFVVINFKIAKAFFISISEVINDKNMGQ